MMDEQTSQDAVALEKRAARAAVRAAVSALTPTDRALGSAAVCQRVMGMEAFAGARTVMVFAPLGDEVDLGRVVERCRETGRRVCAARTDWDQSLLEPALLGPAAGADSAWTGLVGARYGLREPPPDAMKVEPGEIDLVLVPGVAFDLGCHRLGRGGGFYDRFLSRAELNRAFLIGVGFGPQLVSMVQRAGHDRPVDAVVTDREIVVRGACRRGG